MKRFSVFLLSVVLFFYAIDSYAMLQGDLDEDGSVTITDAICALRISAGIEYCDVNSPTFTSADVDGDKIISLSDARNLLLVATGISENIIDGIAVTNLPVTFDGITINSFSLSGNKVTINVKNNTGKAIQSLTTISYKCYNTNGTVLKTGLVFLEDMNSGENCNSYFYIEEGTTKVLFTDVDLCFGSYVAETQTSLINDMNVTTLPVTFDGITINSFSLSGNKVTINVKNNTGKAIQSLTTISYKCYNTNGTVLKTGSVFLEDMNSGENCNSYFYIEEGTTKVLFTDVDLCFGSYVAETQTSLINDMNVTTLPVTFDGITINSFSLSGNKVTINVKNNTGKAIQSLTTISYKCYNTNGTVLKTGSVFLEDMNSGESCNSYFYIEEGTTKVIFTDVDVCA